MAAQHNNQQSMTRSNAQSITRRTFLERAAALGLSSGAALALLEGCGGSATGNNVDITYWNLFGGGDGVRMVQMQNDFIRNHPNINLKAVTLTWGEPYYTKVAMSAAGGRSPDVAISHISRVSTFAESGFLDPFDLNELAKVGITENNFLPEIWQWAQYGGKLYAVPLDTHPYVMFYNTDICKKIGLLDEQGNFREPQGPTELINVFKEAQKITGLWGLTNLSTWRLFASLYGQLGGKILSPDAKQLVIDDDKVLQALDFMADLSVRSKVCPVAVDGAAMFGSGKTGFYWCGEWEVTTFITQKTPFSAAPFPNVFGNFSTEADSHSFILPHQDNPDPQKRAAAYLFVASMLQDSLTWAAGGHIPAYLPITTSPAYKNLKPQSNYASVAKYVVIDPPAWFSGSGSLLESVGEAAFLAVMSNQMTAKQALQEFKTALQKYINIPPPV